MLLQAEKTRGMNSLESMRFFAGFGRKKVSYQIVAKLEQEVIGEGGALGRMDCRVIFENGASRVLLGNDGLGVRPFSPWPHPEEHCEATRLEASAPSSILRDAPFERSSG
jgi:hypothetical protein